MPFIDEATLEQIAESARQARSEVLGFGESTIRRAADVVEIAGTAGALGFINARFGAGGQLAPMGVPIDLWTALVGLGASWMGWAGRFDRDAEMIGAGALAGYARGLGADYGARLKAQSGAPELVGGNVAAQLAAAHAGQGYGGKRYVVSEMRG